MVRYLTTNGKSDTYGRFHPFALRYRRVNGTFYEFINLDERRRLKYKGEIDTLDLDIQSSRR
jgi:hypothetical protein